MADRIIKPGEKPMVMTPAQMKKEACQAEVRNICDKYGMMLIPVLTIVGSNMTTMVEMVEKPTMAVQGSTPNGG